MENAKPKSRNLSTAQYFEVIQQEYLQAEFRRKIYFNPRDKNYYNRTMQIKREIIERISFNNQLDSIFSSCEKMTEVRRCCFKNGNGFPLFPLSEIDTTNYFMPNNEFSYKGKIVILAEADLTKKNAIIKYRAASNIEKTEQVSLEEIIRIL